MTFKLELRKRFRVKNFLKYEQSLMKIVNFYQISNNVLR